MKKILLVVIAAIATMTLTGCKEKYVGLDYVGLDKDVEGDIYVMSWAGDDTYYDNLQNEKQVADITNRTMAQVHAVAKEFNKIYPNVKIHFYGKEDNPDNWFQEMADFKSEYGTHPSVFSLHDVPGAIEKGLIADLSEFSNDPMFKQLSPTLLEATNYYGFQAALPKYFMPQGMFVNNEIIEENNLEEADVDWDFSEFSKVVADGSIADGYVGLAQLPESWAKQMFVYGPLANDGEVNFDTQEIKDFYKDGMVEWNKQNFYAQSGDFTGQHWSWSGKAFQDGVTTIHPEEPWWVTQYSVRDTSWLGEPLQDFDYLPYPSYGDHEQTISSQFDPMAVYNYCLEDGDAACTEEEKAKIKLAYTFNVFYQASEEAYTARAEQHYMDGEVEMTSAVTTFPVTTGDVFEKQLEKFLAVEDFSYYNNKPGFEKVTDIVRKGEYTAFSDKAYPWYYTNEDTGEREEIFKEFLGFQDIDGTKLSDAGWSTLFNSKLETWTTQSNDRLDDAWENIQEALVKYYSYEQNDKRFS